MKKRNYNTIIKKYPDLYEYLSFGVECGIGWYDIIKELSATISKLDTDVRALQVKEKFGELRFYIGSAPDSVYVAINTAEVKSRTTCEDCGKPGKLMGGSWVRTLCDECNKIRLDEFDYTGYDKLYVDGLKYNNKKEIIC